MMYLLDTDVVSELRKAKSRKGDRNVTAWAKSVPTSSLYLSAISVLELELGVLLLERRDAVQGAVLRSWLDEQVLPAFEGRIVSIDAAVARCCARLHVPDPRSDWDALIAATALVHGMAVVTRNVQDFEQLGVELIDPWNQGSANT
jgi:predicted nucleic acid-binding protein